MEDFNCNVVLEAGRRSPNPAELTDRETSDPGSDRGPGAPGRGEITQLARDDGAD